MGKRLSILCHTVVAAHDQAEHIAVSEDVNCLLRQAVLLRHQVIAHVALFLTIVAFDEGFRRCLTLRRPLTAYEMTGEGDEWIELQFVVGTSHFDARISLIGSFRRFLLKHEVTELCDSITFSFLLIMS